MTKIVRYIIETTIEANNNEIARSKLSELEGAIQDTLEEHGQEIYTNIAYQQMLVDVRDV